MEQKKFYEVALLLQGIGYLIEADVFDYYMKFKIFEIFGQDVHGDIVFRAKSDYWRDTTLTTTDACVWMSGSVKWDGCSDWHFCDPEEVSLHFCDKESAENIGKLLGNCYDLAKEHIPHFEGE